MRGKIERPSKTAQESPQKRDRHHSTKHNTPRAHFPKPRKNLRRGPQKPDFCPAGWLPILKKDQRPPPPEGDNSADRSGTTLSRRNTHTHTFYTHVLHTRFLHTACGGVWGLRVFALRFCSSCSWRFAVPSFVRRLSSSGWFRFLRWGSLS